MHPVQMQWQFGCLVHCILGVAAALLQLASYVSATSSPGSIVSPRPLLDPISLPIHVLENSKRSPADNTTFGAGLDVVGLSTDRQSYYTVIQVGGINFRVALDTGSADLWLISSACATDSCTKVPQYPLSYNSPTFVSMDDNTTYFRVRYVDETSAVGFVAGETVQIANFSHSNQTFGLVRSSNVSFSDMISGILGLGFPRLSSFPGKNTSKPFFANLAAAALLEYPLFAFSLPMNSSGTLSLGAIDASIVKDPALISWNQVAQFPPFGNESNESSYLQWAIPINGFLVNDTSFTPIPTYMNSSRTDTLALFDIGSPGIYGSYQDVSRLFAAIKGARLVDSGQWAVPCETTVPLSFTFGTTTFHLLPTDYLRGPASGNPNLCLSWPMALPPNSDGLDWQFGAAFLRTVYSVFSFGIDGKEPPVIGLYPVRNYTNVTDRTQSPADIDSYLSAYSATIPTTLPNYLLPTPSFSIPPYTFNTSVTAVRGGIVPSGLSNTTYSPIFGEKTALDNVSALPTISPSPTVITLTVTESGRLSTTIKTISVPSIRLGYSSSSVTVHSNGLVLLSLIASFIAFGRAVIT